MKFILLSSIQAQPHLGEWFQRFHSPVLNYCYDLATKTETMNRDTSKQTFVNLDMQGVENKNAKNFLQKKNLNVIDNKLFK